MNALFRPLLKQSFSTSGIYLLIIALVLAISATTALKFSNDQIQHAVALQAAEMLAADLVLTDSQPLDDQWRQQAKTQQLQQSEVTFFSTMAHTDAQFVMVNVKAVDNAFPLRGKLETEPQRKNKIASGEVWVSERAMSLLGLELGDDLHIADAVFKVTAKIAYDSNQETGFSGFSPTVIIHQSDVAKTNAIQVGSRIDYRLLMAGQPSQLAAFQKQFETWQTQQPKTAVIDGQDIEVQYSLRLRNANEGNSRLIKPIENLDTFLQLANILTILLCGLAIALTSQRYVQQNQDHIALLRCMGASKKQILYAYLALLTLVLLISILIGTGIGLALGFALLQLMHQFIPHLALSFSAWAMLSGPLPMAMLTSVVVLLGFILPHVLQLLKTPPIRVIRSQAQTQSSMVMMMLWGISSLVLFSLVLTQNLKLTLLVMGAILLLCLVLYVLVWSLVNVIRRSKRPIAAYIRSPKQSALQITALALGLSLMTVLMVLRADLLERWQQQLPAGTPNQFVYGLPPFDMPDFQAQIDQQGWQRTALYPNVRGRLIAKNGQPFASNLIESNNSLRRELNLTQADGYPKDNVILDGRAEFHAPFEVSVEAKTAQSLGIQLGDELSFSLPEGVLKAKVINLRSVEWESFSPNFFFIFSPQSMDANAGSYLGSFYVPPQDQPKLISIIQQFSNTVFIDVSLILQEIKRIIEILVQVISILALLVALSGILVLVACLNLMMDERKREVALLRSFGSSKAQLKRMLTFEVGLMGLLAGIVACIFAEIISALVATQMQLSIQLHGQIWLLLPVLMAILCAFIGRYRLAYLCDIPPLQSLREINQ